MPKKTFTYQKDPGAPKKKTPIENDIDAFYHAISGTKPLIKNKIRLEPPRSKKTHYPAQKKQKLKLSDSLELPPVSGEAFISFKHRGLSHQILCTLRKGQYNIEAKLDLHGMTVDQAQVSLENFLEDCLKEGIRVVLIIHGKGQHDEKPILKNKLNRWLRAAPVVLAFCSATTLHGNRGALYVLLNHYKRGENFE